MITTTLIIMVIIMTTNHVFNYPYILLWHKRRRHRLCCKIN